MFGSLYGWFAVAQQGCENRFLGLNTWFHYLETTAPPECSIVDFKVLGSGSDIPLVLLSVIDGLLRIAGLIAVIFVIYGAVQYTTSQGQPDQTSRAQSTITNALIGLAISIIAVALVAFIGNRLG